jgi:hypothetical protein
VLARALVAALLYAAALVAWLLNGYGVFGDGSELLVDDGAGFAIVVIGGILAGLAIGRWWALLVPLAAVLAAIGLELDDRDAASGYAQDAGPLEVALLVVLPFGCLACAAGVFLHKTARASRRRARGRRASERRARRAPR